MSFHDEEIDYDARRPWVINNGTIYVGDMGSQHVDVGPKYGFDYRFLPEKEGDIIGGKVRANDPAMIPPVQRFYDKHFKDLDKLGSWIDDPEPKEKLNLHVGSGPKWAYLDGNIAFGHYYPQLIYDLANAQNLMEANQLSNLVAAGQWPVGISHDLAIGLHHPDTNTIQIEKANVDRSKVRDRVQSALSSKTSAGLDVYHTIANATGSRWDGVYLNWPNGQKVALDLQDQGDTMVIENIRAEPEGVGLGSEVMKALQQYAIQHGQNIRAQNVLASDFFDKHGFSEDDDPDNQDDWQEASDYWWYPE